ncbi:MAG: hypothetical protein ACXW27_15510 [Allosphingosinicella sp.]
MRNPARKALYCLTALLAGAALIWFGASRHQRAGEDWTSIVPLVLGFTLAPFGFVFLIQALFAMRGRARLLAGHKVIARWHVYPAEWEQFRGLDSGRAAERISLGNDLWVRKAAPREPVEVIVGEKSALVDGSYHPLSPRGLPELRGVRWLEGPPACLEFELRYPRSRYGSPVTTTLRIPVPASARAAAGQVFGHFERLTRRSPPLALRNPPKTYRICALLVFGAAAAGGVGYWLTRGLPDGADPLVPLGLLIGATILGVFAIILALATWLLTRRP